MKEITTHMRMSAAERVSAVVDRAVRKESAYGEKNAAAFDEPMALAGVANALATWCTECTEEQLHERLKTVVMGTVAAWRDKKASATQH
jgi:hypothetical protein